MKKIPTPIPSPEGSHRQKLIEEHNKKVDQLSNAKITDLPPSALYYAKALGLVKGWTPTKNQLIYGD